MHRHICELDEILRLICRFCDHASLACLARSSKLFLEPALDELWETLISFNNALKLLPEDLLTWRPNDGGVLVPIVTRLIIPRDWSRFNFYAPRIKYWPLEELGHIEEAVVDHIAFGRIPDHIFPRLTHIAISGVTIPSIHLQTLLLCPTLRSVTIWNPNPSGYASRAMNTLLKTLADKAPSLKSFIVQWGPPYIPMVLPTLDVPGPTSLSFSLKDGITDFYDHNASLQTIHMGSSGCLSPMSLGSISLLPHLTSLHLNIYGIQDINEYFSAILLPVNIDNQLDNYLPSTFPELHDLSLSGELDDFVIIMSRFPNRQLVNIAFSVRTYPRFKPLLALFTAVASSFHNTLRSFRFHAPKEELDTPLAVRAISFSPDQYSHTATLLHPLLTLHQLSMVHIELGIPIQITDDDMTDIGSAWTNVESLNLCCDPYCDRTRGLKPSLTVKGVFRLLQSCLKLKHLGLHVDFTTGLDPSVVLHATPFIHYTRSNGGPGCKVAVFDAGKSWLINPPLVAALLSGILPNLTIFKWSGMPQSISGVLQNQENGYDPDRANEADDQSIFRFSGQLSANHSPAWKQVYDLLPVFYAVRENERRALNNVRDDD